jgi:DNA-binding response OmpR family regulator
MSRGRILVVEDDTNLRTTLADNLREEGYESEEVGTCDAARAALSRRAPDLIILDVMLPDGDGYSLCRALRQQGVECMVMMLTARTLEEDLVRGFDAGAQDYLGKPYRLRELLARIAALLRRASPTSAPTPTVVRFAGFTLDLGRRVLTTSDDRAVELTRKEFDLLAFLLRNRERALTRDEILDGVWGSDVVVDAHTVDNFVSSLRKKLGGASSSGFAIQTIRGVGFRMEVLA